MTIPFWPFIPTLIDLFLLVQDLSDIFEETLDIKEQKLCQHFVDWWDQPKGQMHVYLVFSWLFSHSPELTVWFTVINTFTSKTQKDKKYPHTAVLFPILDLTMLWMLKCDNTIWSIISFGETKQYLCECQINIIYKWTILNTFSSVLLYYRDFKDFK